MSEEIKNDGEKKKEDWMNSKWRPMMGWMYMLICTMDMVLFPILWSLLQAVTHTAITQWNPLTLQGAGLFHIAMGAVLGIAAFGRTQEKLNGANNGGAQLPSSGSSTFGVPQAGATSTGGFGASSPTPTGFSGGGTGGTPSATSFGTTGATGGFGAGVTTATAPAPVSTGWGGKPAPAEFQHPAI